MKTIVSKKDGSKESYSQDKIARVAIAAGLLPSQAQRLTVRITEWIKETHSSTITTLQIRNKLVEELKRVDKSAADLFLWYEKTKEK